MKHYKFTLGDITYSFEEERDVSNRMAFVNIMVNNIVIYHNRYKYTNEGLLSGVKKGWNHTAPKELLEQLKEASMIINEHIKEIEFHLKCNVELNKHNEERRELERIFCKKI